MIKNDAMTDKEIYDLAVQDWVNTLSQLWIAFGKPVNNEQLKVYARQLSGVHLGVLDQVIKTILQEHKYNSVPTLAMVWDVIKRDYGTVEDANASVAVPWVFQFTENGLVELI